MKFVSYFRSNPAKSMQVRVGSTYSDNGGKIVDIETGKYHEKFGNQNMDYDVAILKLKEPLTFESNIAPIKVADKNFVLEQGTEATITGWGKTQVLQN